MPRVRIVTDSTADVPAKWVARYNIHVVPTYVHFGAESFADDGRQLSRADFYQRLTTSKARVTTSAGPPGEALVAMRQALAEADHLIAVTAASKLSGIFNAFRLAAEQTAPDRITLIDSAMTTMGEGWQVITAAEMAAGGAPPEDIERKLLAMQPRSDVWAALDTVEYVRRSGRVSWAAGMVGEIFRIKPIIRLHDGVVSSHTRVRTAQRGFDVLVELARSAAPLERLAVLHTANLEAARRLLAALQNVHPAHEPVIVEVTPVLGVHVGVSGLGLATVRA